MFDSIRSKHRFFTFALMMMVVVSFVLTGAYGYKQFLEIDTSIAKVG